MTLPPFIGPRQKEAERRQQQWAENLVQYKGVWMTEGEASACRMQDYYDRPSKLLEDKK